MYMGFLEDQNNINVKKFLEAYLFSQEKVSKLHEEKNIDPRYYSQHASLALMYVLLIDSGTISSANLAKSYNILVEASINQYKSILLKFEDIERCNHRNEFATEAISIINRKYTKTYKNILTTKGNVLSNTAKHAALNLSEKTIDREPNTYYCKKEGSEPLLISNEAWLKKREEVREKFKADYFPEQQSK